MILALVGAGMWAALLRASRRPAVVKAANGHDGGKGKAPDQDQIRLPRRAFWPLFSCWALVMAAVRLLATAHAGGSAMLHGHAHAIKPLRTPGYHGVPGCDRLVHAMVRAGRRSGSLVTRLAGDGAGPGRGPSRWPTGLFPGAPASWHGFRFPPCGGFRRKQERDEIDQCYARALSPPAWGRCRDRRVRARDDQGRYPSLTIGHHGHQ